MSRYTLAHARMPKGKEDLKMITLKEVIEHVGASLDPRTLEPVTFEKGYQVSIKDLVKVHEDYLDNHILNELILKANFEALLNNGFVGLWYNENQVYIDISKYFESYTEALKVGIGYNQKAIFDWSTKESIYLKESEDKQNA